VTTILVVLALVGLGLFVASIVVRSNSQSRFEVKSVDIVLALLPVVVWLLATGRITKLAVPGLEVETAAQAIQEAAQGSIETQVTTVEEAGLGDAVDVIDRARKGDVDLIPEIDARGTKALAFQLGQGNYDADVIREYLDVLVGRGQLRYLVLNEPDGELFGVYDATKVYPYFTFQLERQAPRTRAIAVYDRFAASLNRADPRSREWLASLPGFTPASSAVRLGISKRQALEQMESAGVEVLPAVRDDGRFVGVVHRSRLTAGLILEVSRALEKNP
jgi:hypothetical protein